MTVTIKPGIPLGPVVFITGIERRPNGAVRIYVGPRYEGHYILAHPDDVEGFQRGWNSGGHVYMDPKALEDLPIFTDAGPDGDA